MPSSPNRRDGGGGSAAFPQPTTSPLTQQQDSYRAMFEVEAEDELTRVFDPYQRALRARWINVSAARYKPEHINLDESQVNMNLVYNNFAGKMKKTQCPRVLLVMANLFQGAGIAVCLQRFGCTTVLCHSGSTAYTQYLRRGSSEFDVCIVDWDLPDVGGRDLAFYEKEAGGSLPFIAVVPPKMNPADALRGGADLVFKRPLVIHLYVIREVLLPNARSSYGFPTRIMQLRSKATEMRTLLDALAFVDTREVTSLVDEVQMELEEDADDVIDANAEVVDRLVTMLKQSAREAAAAAEEPVWDESLIHDAEASAIMLHPPEPSDDTASSAGGGGTSRRASKAISEVSASSDNAPGKPAALDPRSLAAKQRAQLRRTKSLTLGHMSKGQADRVLKALTNALVTFNQMKRELASTQADFREFRQRHLDPLSHVEDARTYHPQLLETPIDEIEQLGRVAAVDALKRIRLALFLMEQENEQLLADNDRLNTFKVELEDAITRSGLAVNFIEAPPKSAALAPEASESWTPGARRSFSGIGRVESQSSMGDTLRAREGSSSPTVPTASSPTASSPSSPSRKGGAPRGVRIAVDAATASNRFAAAGSRRATAHYSVQDLQKMQKTLARRKSTKTTGPDPLMRMLEMNRGLEEQLMSIADGASKKIRQHGKIVAGLAIPFASILSGRTANNVTPVDLAYELSVRMVSDLCPIVNAFMARVMATHPVLHPKCETFVESIRTAFGKVVLADAFEAIKQWSDKRQADAAAVAQKAKAAASSPNRSKAELTKSTSGAVGSRTNPAHVTVVTRYRTLQNRVAKHLAAVNNKVTMQSYWVKWCEFADLATGKGNYRAAWGKGSDTPRRSKIGTPQSQPLSVAAPVESTNLALTRLKKENTFMKKELEDLRLAHEDACADRKSLTALAQEREQKIVSLTAAIESKNKIVADFALERVHFQQRIDRLYAEASRHAKDGTDLRKDLDRTVELLQHETYLRPTTCEVGVQCATLLPSPPKAVAAAAGKGPRGSVRGGRPAGGGDLAMSTSMTASPRASGSTAAPLSPSASASMMDSSARGKRGSMRKQQQDMALSTSRRKTSTGAAASSGALNSNSVEPFGERRTSEQPQPHLPAVTTSDEGPATPRSAASITEVSNSSMGSFPNAAAAAERRVSSGEAAVAPAVVVSPGGVSAASDSVSGLSTSLPELAMPPPVAADPQPHLERHATASPQQVASQSEVADNAAAASAPPSPVADAQVPPPSSAPGGSRPVTSGDGDAPRGTKTAHDNESPVASTLSPGISLTAATPRHAPLAAATEAKDGTDTKNSEQEEEPADPPPPPPKPTKKELREQRAKERAKQHTERMRAARLGIKLAKAAHQSDDATSTAGGGGDAAGTSDAHRRSPFLVGHSGSQSQLTSRSGTPEHAAPPVDRSKFASPDAAAKTMGRIQASMGTLRKATGLNLGVAFPAADTNPAIADVLFEVIRALTTAADAAAAGVGKKKAQPPSTGRPPGIGHAKEPRSPADRRSPPPVWGASDGPPPPQAKRSQVPHLPDVGRGGGGGAPPNAAPPVGHGSATARGPGGPQQAGSRWAAVKVGSNLAGRSALTGAYVPPGAGGAATARGGAAGGFGALPSIRR